MHWWYDGSDSWWLHMWFPFFPIIFMVLCLVVFLFVMVPMMRGHGPWRDRSDYSTRNALDILNERYAKGEIDKGEYEEKRRLISSS